MSTRKTIGGALGAIIVLIVVDYRHCNQKNLKIYLSTLHKSV